MSAQRNSKRFSDEIRQVVDNLQAEDDLQKKITARILGAAAQISNNHERLIEEVADVTRCDLDSIEALQKSPIHSAEQLKKKFKTLNQAKQHFGVPARSWKSLAEKLNLQISAPITAKDKQQDQGVTERLARIEQRIEQLQSDVQTILETVGKLIG